MNESQEQCQVKFTEDCNISIIMSQEQKIERLYWRRYIHMKFDYSKKKWSGK